MEWVSIIRGLMRGKDKRVYLDYAAAHPPRASAVRAFEAAEALTGNPSGVHMEGRNAAEALALARDTVARTFGVRARDCVLTSGGTEANNLAVLGTFNRLVRLGRAPESMQAIVSAIEHPSVLACFEYLEEQGVQVVYLAPQHDGRIRPEDLKAVLTADTVLVSVGWGNSEIGVVQPIAALTQVIRGHEVTQGTSVVFHSDLGQAPLYLPASVPSLGVDLATIDAGKLGGVRGIGTLVVRGELPAPILFGGDQERGVRPGTPSVALAAAFASALTEMSTQRVHEAARLGALRQELLAAFAAAPALAGSVIHGTHNQKYALPHIINISIPVIDTEYALLALDAAGFALSSKSSCREGEPSSHVVAALAGAAWEAEHTLRISMGLGTTAADIRRFVDVFQAVIAQVQALHTAG